MKCEDCTFCRLGNLVTFTSGGTPSKSNPNYWNGNIPWISAKTMKMERVSTSDLFITEDGLQAGSRLAKQGSILILTRGSGLFNDIPICLVEKDLAFNQDIKCLNSCTSIDNKFIFYWLLSQKEYLSAKVGMTGIGAGKFDTDFLMNLMVPIFSTEVRNRIVAIADSISEKIAINRAINDNLQQQLRTIFKAEFTDNPELENITQIPLSELCHVVTKGTTPTTLGKPFVESGINFIKAESILDDHFIDKSKFAFIDEETNALLKRSKIHAGDVVFTIAGTLGRFALIDENVLPANTNQAVAIIRADVEKVLPEYIYTCFIGEWHTDYYAKRVQQAVQANLSLTTIKSLPIPLLDEAKMSKYLSLILPLIKEIKTNEAQNEKLAALRDNLLPKLMSGEIDVSAVQL